MKTKETIIEVIRQEMRHNQYMYALGKLGIEIDHEFDPDFLGIISKLLGVKEYPELWMSLYLNYLERGANYEVVPFGDNLYPLAEECYQTLMAIGFGDEANLEGKEGI